MILIHQRHRQTDRRTTCNLNTALCTSASCGKNWCNSSCKRKPVKWFSLEILLTFMLHQWNRPQEMITRRWQMYFNSNMVHIRHIMHIGTIHVTSWFWFFIHSKMSCNQWQTERTVTESQESYRQLFSWWCWGRFATMNCLTVATQSVIVNARAQMSQWVSSFLIALQHNVDYLVPYH